jgi:hypothetical protein
MGGSSARQRLVISLPSLIVEIYIATFAGMLSTLLLAGVYLADRWEREPVELIQDSFLVGLLGQLVLILAVSAAFGELRWSGPWALVTVGVAGLYLPYRLHRHAEVDERFDGVVYSVALMAGAVCVVHLFNLPRVVAASPYGDAIGPGDAPGLRDLLIIAGWPGFTAELGRGLVLISAAVLLGAVLGVLQHRGWPPSRTALVCTAVGLVVVTTDLAAGGSWPVRAALVAAAVAAGLVLKRRSVFRDRPQPTERDLLVTGLKTVLIVFGAVLLATVLLQAASDPPIAPEPGLTHDDHTGLNP